MAAEEGAEGMANGKHRVPAWAANLLVFLLLFLGATAYFLWQIHQARKDFFAHVREHALVVAEVVQQNAKGSLLARKAVEEILEAFLGNTARFVDYLDQVEPFTSEELAAFAEEAGLTGITIQRTGKKDVLGPPEWLPKPCVPCPSSPSLKHVAGAHMYVLSWNTASACIRVGIADTGIQTLQEQLGLDNVIEAITSIPGMVSVKVVPPSGIRKKALAIPSVTITGEGPKRTAEARVPLESGELAVSLNAGYLQRSVSRLWRDFFLFSAGLAALAVFLSLMLYRYQSAHLKAVRQFERELAQVRENASLGRSAAAIAHEVKNPLNTMGMGLQRLQLEAQGLAADERRQIALMLDAVKRANSSMDGLLKYARPRKPNIVLARLDRIVEDMLHFFESRFKASRIDVSTKITFRESIPCDPDLLKQVVENLLKNAVEAQPQGGFIRISVNGNNQEVCLQIQNGGFTLNSREADRILDPYFTTKVDGTGLGLSISRRIVAAHGGKISVRKMKADAVEIVVCLPKDAKKEKIGS